MYTTAALYNCNRNTVPYIFDIEADGLLENATRIHCLCYYNLVDGSTGSLTSLTDIGEFLLNADVLIGHNIIRYDIPLLELLVHQQFQGRMVDTLALSWYLYPERNLHGLESWGDDFGIPKPAISDWQNLTQEEYIHRCEEDVKINTKLWLKQKKYLTRIYGDWNEAKRLIEYLTFKMDCAREQERSKWKLDKEYALESLKKLTERREEKLAVLTQAMPKVPVYALRKPPAKPFKKDGTLSVAGATWKALLKKHNLPEKFSEEIKEQISEKEPNPGSHDQVKSWLFSLGWKPCTFKYVKEDDGTTRKIPQVKEEHGPELTDSVLRLAERNPAVHDLQGLGIVNHRISILNGFLDYAGDDTYVAAEIAGLTNTLRFKHKTVVNLPKVSKPYGEEIRGALIAREGYELCDSDMAGLEDRLKQHFIYPYDPEYVKEMSNDDYDPHLSLALLAKEVTDEQVEKYKNGTDKSIKPIRDIFKNGNYACQYGAGPPRLALTADISLAKAEQVWKTYWEKNWAIKKVAEEQLVKTISGQMWLFNPISKLWYSLRYEKDKFSTLIQGTAAYVFDEWVRIFRLKRPQLTGQFHDEVVLEIKKGNREKCEALLKNAISELNNILKLNRELGIDVQFGDRYSSIH
jgi:hypothetical protein